MLALTTPVNILSRRRNKKNCAAISGAFTVNKIGNSRPWKVVEDNYLPHQLCKSVLDSGRKAARRGKWGCLTKERLPGFLSLRTHFFF